MRKVLITGGTKGIGLATARAFARDGDDVTLSYRSDEASAKAAVEEIRKLGRKCEAIMCDLSEDGAADRLFDAYKKYESRLDVYVHNAAATAFKDLLEIQPHHIDKTFNITVKSFIRGAQRCVELMPEGGTIITVSGMDTLKAVPRHGLLGAAKSRLETLTAYFAHELGPKRIRVNGVNPGFVATDSTKKYLGGAFGMVTEAFSELLPTGRGATPEDIAEIITLLSSSKAAWLVGQTLRADGGENFAMPRWS